jgi:ankyrin repeat protein
MPTRLLPNDPSLEHLRKEAKRLHKAAAAGDADARAQVAEFHPEGDAVLHRFALADAQLVVARSYRFASWAKLKAHIEAIEPFVWNPPPLPRDPNNHVEVFIRLACLDYGFWQRTNPARARRLLDEHPEVSGATIYAAAAAGHVRAVRQMIERDPALAHARGGPLDWEPLLYACYSRFQADDLEFSTIDVARELLARGADPNSGVMLGGNYTFTALTGAFGRGEDNMNQLPHPRALELARLLLDAGADPNDSQTLYNRHFEENDDHFHLLFEYGLGMLVQELCWAAEHGYRNRVKLLLNHGVDVNGASLRDGRTPYEAALRAGHTAVAEYLLTRGATKVELDPLETFAQSCIAGRRGEARARLAADPALLDRLGHEGRMAMLHRAVDKKSPDGIRLIVELGVDVNGIVHGSGLDRAPLHNAAVSGDLDLVNLLLDLGADPALRDATYHAAPIGWAAYGQHWRIVSHLMPMANIYDAVRMGGVERVRALLQEDPELVRRHNTDGDSLMFHLHPDHPRLAEMIQLLLAHGADINARNRAGQTVIERALARGAVEFAERLRAHGAT